MTAKCLICYESLDDEQQNYHRRCMKAFFGSEKIPQFDLNLEEMDQLAKQIIRSQMTVPGVQAKISLELHKAKGKDPKFTIVGAWGRYILKPPVKRYPSMPEVEHMTMWMALKCGIKTVPHALIRFNTGELAYLSKRIDRSESGQKIHMEDMCQLMERMTEDKYKSSMEKVGQFIRDHTDNSILDTIRFFEIALFSFITGNADMHLKNFSLWYPKSNVIQLSPAYDLLSTRLLIPESMDPEEMALTVNGKKRKLNKSDFIKLGESIGLGPKQIDNALIRMINNREQMLTTIGSGFLNAELCEAYSILIQSRIERLI